jgi:adenylate cyclase
MQLWRTAVTRSWPGTILLLGAAIAHIGLGLYRQSRRSTFRLPGWEATQIVTGLSIPYIILTHFMYTRVSSSVYATRDSYLYELYALWPAKGLEQSLILLVVWVHGCIGLHFWLRLSPLYRRLQGVALALAVALPVLAIAGFSVAGRQVAAQIDDLESYEKLRVESNAPDKAASSRLAGWVETGRYVYLALLLGVAAFPLVGYLRRVAAPKVEISYLGGPTVRVASGPTLLEISRARGVPHTSVCGGRGRCSTCRVRVEEGLALLPPPAGVEAKTLGSISATPDVRLACQIRPRSALTVQRLVSPQSAAVRGRVITSEAQGVERTLVVLFLDVRGFTQFSERKLPYDVVFILNRLFAETGMAIREAGGHVDKYMGDGLMAIFGQRTGAGDGCRRALEAARQIDAALERLNAELATELGQPFRIGMGIHVGPLVVGRIGHAETASETVIGSTVNAASRLEALTKEKAVQLIVSEDVLKRAGVAGEAFPREDVAVRGLSKPLSVALIGRARDLVLKRAQASPAAAQDA